VTLCGRVSGSKWFEGSYHNQVINTSALYMGGSGFKYQYEYLCPDWTNFMESHLRTWWQGCTNPGWQVAVAAQLYTETPVTILAPGILRWLVHFWKKFCTPA